MAKVTINGMMADIIMVNGNKINYMVKAYLNGLMEKYIKVNII